MLGWIWGDVQVPQRWAKKVLLQLFSWQIVPVVITDHESICPVSWPAKAEETPHSKPILHKPTSIHFMNPEMSIIVRIESKSFLSISTLPRFNVSKVYIFISKFLALGIQHNLPWNEGSIHYIQFRKSFFLLGKITVILNLSATKAGNEKDIIIFFSRRVGIRMTQ